MTIRVRICEFRERRAAVRVIGLFLFAWGLLLGWGGHARGATC